MIRNLKNVSESILTLEDFQGQVIAPGETIDGLQFGEAILHDSISVADHIMDGDLEVNDGYQTYSGIQALDVIRGGALQLTPDGKTIFTMSDRPQDTIRFFTSCADNMTTQKIGEGDKLDFDVAAGQTVSKDLQFIEDIYIKDGFVNYKSYSNVSWLSVSIVCPAGLPFPAPALNGNYDFTGGQWVANETNTGRYFILGVETYLFRFANRLPMNTFTNREQIIAPEPQRIPSPYQLRITVFNGADATANLLASFYVGGYRFITVN